jgi:hypothetical protein
MSNFQRWEPTRETLAVKPKPDSPTIHDGTPKSYERIQEAYVGERDIVIVGFPMYDDELHSCDEMGCGCSHVLLRIPLSSVNQEHLRVLRNARDSRVTPVPEAQRSEAESQ